jgi:hypothetical protein
MCIGAADAECAYASAARPAISFPFGSFAVDPERTVLEIKVRIRAVEMKRRRKNAMSHDVRGIDQPVTPAAISRCPTLVLAVPIVQNCFRFGPCAKSLGQACEFDGIAQRRPGAVRFDVANGFRIDPGGFVRHRYDAGLPLHARCRVADLAEHRHC